MSKITIIGAGLVGSAMAVMLTRRGHHVNIYEKRAKRSDALSGNSRSINLAISERGWHTLRTLGIAAEVKKTAIPMYGRMIHNIDSSLVFQQYGTEHQSIYSVSRNELNNALTDLLIASDIPLHRGYECLAVDLENATAILLDKSSKQQLHAKADVIIAADGALSAVRNTPPFQHELQYIDFGYKELTIPAGNSGWLLEKNALHIWPRKHFMLIALPNADGTFTCTLFLPYSDSPSFDNVQTTAAITGLFEKYFPDILIKAPGIVQEYQENKDYRLSTVRCTPWHYKDKALLIGDAAHGILPFYGQGANMGFEDCTVLNQVLDDYNDNWSKVLEEYERIRRPDCDAIAQLSIQNFVEMRDKVADPLFLRKKEIEAYLSKTFPEKWTSLYTMISFTRTPYAEAYSIALQQEKIMERIMDAISTNGDWRELDYNSILEQENISI